ncbi:hypothetical protein KC686_03800, partial [Candidatus Woesebacteria bacterium]|nr:hypothetical protein [Candidatus Woesebacteria bacterium]
MWQSIKKLDKWLDTHWVFLLFLPIVLVLRVPGFSEPYWYGDEGIYLAIGNALNHGQRLYADIVDHKTPLIYYFAQVPSQVTFRVLLTVWMLSATGFFYSTLRSLTKTRVAAIVGLSLFTLCTTLPALEGNIPNGELFVIGFVLAGGAVLFKQPITARLMSGARSSLPTIQTIPFWPTLIAGVGTGLGLLVKVPALFDAAALTSVFYFIALKTLRPTTWKQQWTTLLSFALKHWLVFAAGFFLPLSVSILYFWSIGAGSEYLEFGLLYNFHYSSNWGLGIENPLLAWLFTL